MIRIVYLLRRKPGLDKAAYTDYWLNEHGPLVASVASKLNMLRYVQVHTLDDPANDAMSKARGGMEPVYDGVAEVWFETEEAMVEAMQSEAGSKAGALLVEDEAKFIDLPNSPIWLTHDYPQVNPTPENLVATPRSGLVKLYFPLRMRKELDIQQAKTYWYSNHGPIIRRQAAASGIQRYIQVHRVEHELETALREARGTQVPAYDGHAELWFDRSVLGVSTPERVEANQRAIEDEAKFIDFQRSTMWLAKEHVFVDHM